MDFLGFSSEDLEKLNSQGNKKKSEEFMPKICPIPDLTPYPESVRAKYMQIREQEIQRLKARHYNQNRSLMANDKNLNSQLQRVQKFIKKLKSVSDENREELLKEVSELNLKKFISEVAHSLSENKMQIKDLPIVVDIACCLHQQYPEFQKVFESYLKKQHKEGEIVRKRNILRLIVELLCFGLWSDLAGFFKVTRDYVRAY